MLAACYQKKRQIIKIEIRWATTIPFQPCNGTDYSLRNLEETEATNAFPKTNSISSWKAFDIITDRLGKDDFSKKYPHVLQI